MHAKSAEDSANTTALMRFLHRRWVTLVATALACVGGIGGFVVGVILIMASGGRYVAGPWLFALLFVAPFLIVATHECGHLVGARLSGMLVLGARVGLLELLPRRRGWRFRLCRPRIRSDAAGYLMAIPDFSRPLRPQQIACTLGGPAANGLAAAALLVVAASNPGGNYTSLWLAFAVWNGCVGLINLIPNAGYGSDGYQFVLACRAMRADDPALAYCRCIWRSLTGTTAERLPVADLELLERLPAPIPSIRNWYALKAAQNVGDWPRAVAVADSIDDDARRFDAASMSSLLPFIDQVRIERAFSRSMIECKALQLDREAFASLRWYAPYLEPRCAALSAAIAGDAAACERLLLLSQRAADNAFDQALRASEAWIRGAIRQKLRPSHDVEEVVQKIGVEIVRAS